MSKKKGPVKKAGVRSPLKRVVELSTGKVKLTISPQQVRVLEAEQGLMEGFAKLAGWQWKNVLAGMEGRGLVVANSKSWRLTRDGRRVLEATKRK